MSGIDELSKNMPQNFKDLFFAALGPVKGAVESATAPIKHLGDIVAAHKAGDREGMQSSISKFVDSLIPGTGNANEMSQNTLKDIQEGNAGALAGTGTGLAAQLALVKGMSGSSDFKKLIYTGKIGADGLPELTKTARSILHPTELPENVLRKIVSPPDEVTQAMKAQAGEAAASDLEKQMSEVETARQKELAAQERLKNIDAQSRMTRERQQAALDAQAAKNAPKPAAPSPFGNATPTNVSIGDLKLPEPGAVTSATGELPKGSPTPFVSKFTEAEPSRIVTPLSPAPAVGRTLVSYDRNLLVHMARGGDLNALRELIRNPGGIDVKTAVPNSKYLLEAAQ